MTRQRRPSQKIRESTTGVEMTKVKKERRKTETTDQKIKQNPIQIKEEELHPKENHAGTFEFPKIIYVTPLLMPLDSFFGNLLTSPPIVNKILSTINQDHQPQNLSYLNQDMLLPNQNRSLSIQNGSLSNQSVSLLPQDISLLPQDTPNIIQAPVPKTCLSFSSFIQEELIKDYIPNKRKNHIGNLFMRIYYGKNRQKFSNFDIFYSEKSIQMQLELPPNVSKKIKSNYIYLPHSHEDLVDSIHEFITK